MDETTLRSWMERAQKQAGLGINRGQIHILRHTFCSHLAMKNVPPRVIQELAGHADLTTTMRYMHLAKGSKEAAIAVLDQPAVSAKNVEVVEYPRSPDLAAENRSVKSINKMASPQRFEDVFTLNS